MSLPPPVEVPQPAGRRRLRHRAAAAFGCALLLVTGAPARADGADAARLQAGREAYFPCSSCHGPGGEGSEPSRAPPLAGLPYDYLVRQLGYFRSGARGAHPADVAGQEMSLLARSLPDPAAVEAVATYIAALPAAAPPFITVRGRPRRGARLYPACATCHGAAAEGDAALAAPPLRQLPDWYLRAQIEAFRLGWRGTDAADVPGQAMRAATTTLAGDRDATDLASYIVTLR